MGPTIVYIMYLFTKVNYAAATLSLAAPPGLGVVCTVAVAVFQSAQVASAVTMLVINRYWVISIAHASSTALAVAGFYLGYAGFKLVKILGRRRDGMVVLAQSSRSGGSGDPTTSGEDIAMAASSPKLPHQDFKSPPTTMREGYAATPTTPRTLGSKRDLRSSRATQIVKRGQAAELDGTIRKVTAVVAVAVVCAFLGILLPSWVGYQAIRSGESYTDQNKRDKDASNAAVIALEGAAWVLMCGVCMVFAWSHPVPNRGICATPARMCCPV